MNGARQQCVYLVAQTDAGREPVREPVRLAVPWAGVGVLAAQGQEGTCASGLAGAAVTHVHTLLNTHQPPHLKCLHFIGYKSLR